MQVPKIDSQVGQILNSGMMRDCDKPKNKIDFCTFVLNPNSKIRFVTDPNSIKVILELSGKNVSHFYTDEKISFKNKSDEKKKYIIIEFFDEFDMSTSFVKKLPKRLIETGNVYKLEFFKSFNVEMSFLKLEKDSAIKKHKHTEDCEWYILIPSAENTFCPMGEEHELKNCTGIDIQVISVKCVP